MLQAPEIWLQNVQNVNIFYRDITSRATPERSADFILILMLAKRKKASTKLYFFVGQENAPSRREDEI